MVSWKDRLQSEKLHPFIEDKEMNSLLHVKYRSFFIQKTHSLSYMFISSSLDISLVLLHIFEFHKNIPLSSHLPIISSEVISIISLRQKNFLSQTYMVVAKHVYNTHMQTDKFIASAYMHKKSVLNWTKT
jgi:hypothetical protein